MDKAKSDKGDKKLDGDKDKKVEGDRKSDGGDKKAEGDKKSDRQPANEPKETRPDNSEQSRGPNSVSQGDMMPPGSAGVGPSMIGAAEMGPAAGSFIAPVMGGGALPPPPQNYFMPPPTNPGLLPISCTFCNDVIQNKKATVWVNNASRRTLLHKRRALSKKVEFTFHLFYLTII